MARNFKVGDIVTHQIIGNTNSMQRNRSHAIITKIGNGYIFYQYPNGVESSESISFANNGALSKSRNQDKLKQKYGW